MELDPAYVEAQLASPPFVVVEGVSNIRSLGNYPSEFTPDHCTKPNFVFRSGEIFGITSTGKTQLKQLGIRNVFDLRSDIEIVKFSCATQDLGSQVEIRRIPVLKDEDYSPEMLTLRSKQYKTGRAEDLMEAYAHILEEGVSAFSTIFKHIRDNPDKAFLFHCAAGKDRTGVLAALILKVAGVDDGHVANDYALTRVGREPQRAATMAKLSQLPDYINDREGLLNVMDCRHEAMIAFLQLLVAKYGGVERYLQNHLGLSVADITRIRGNLLIKSELPEPSLTGNV